MPVSDYQKEQLESLTIVKEYLSRLDQNRKERLLEEAGQYFSFRKKVGLFLSEFFGEVCRLKCYQSKLSACCSREGIITFFADVVLNALVSTNRQVDSLIAVLSEKEPGNKCIYLGPNGCLWSLKPVVCEMFLCDSAKKAVFEKHPDAQLKWETFKRREKDFKWPDKPVLFDKLEKIFMNAGYISPLMYLHNSPGLLRIKRLAGLATKIDGRSKSVRRN